MHLHYVSISYYQNKPFFFKFNHTTPSKEKSFPVPYLERFVRVGARPKNYFMDYLFVDTEFVRKMTQTVR